VHIITNRSIHTYLTYAVGNLVKLAVET